MLQYFYLDGKIKVFNYGYSINCRNNNLMRVMIVFITQMWVFLIPSDLGWTVMTVPVQVILWRWALGDRTLPTHTLSWMYQSLEH